MAAQEYSKRKGLAKKPDGETRVVLEKGLAGAEEAVAAARAEVERGSQAWVKAEQALSDAQEALAAARAAIEAERSAAPLTAFGEEEVERRTSFIVRLTVDKQGQPRRIEVEHVPSTKKENLTGMDTKRLAAFMLECSHLPPPARTNDPTNRPGDKSESSNSGAF